MQHTNYIPVHYRDGNLNVRVGGFNWAGNERYGDDRGYDFQVQPVERCRSYNKGMVWWIMQKHEATFRLQVQELHRLYGRQRELMEEMKMRQNCLPSPISGLLSQAFSGMNPSVLQEMSFLLGVHPQGPFCEPTTTGSPLKSAVNFQDHLFPASSSNGNMFNLEVPLSGKHIEEGNPLQAADLHREKAQSELSDSNGRRTDFPIDLNQPIQIEPPVSSSITPYDSSEAMISEQSGVINLDDSNLVMDFDLNSVPSSSSSGIETSLIVNDATPASGHEIPDMNSKRLSGYVLEIDLNSAIPADEASDLDDPTKDADSMYPISPENQEASPPRCKSGSPPSSIDLDVLAASTLATMLAEGNGDNCLLWFAEIASSAGDHPKNDATVVEHHNEHDGNKKRKSKEKQGDHRASSRIHKRCKPEEKASLSKGAANATWKQQLRCRSWGKTGKREGGCRKRRVV